MKVKLTNIVEKRKGKGSVKFLYTQGRSPRLLNCGVCGKMVRPKIMIVDSDQKSFPHFSKVHCRTPQNMSKREIKLLGV